jgi:hypothetical protein
MKIVKYIYSSFVAVFFLTTFNSAQPLNNSFENWDAGTGMPVDWLSSGVPSVEQTSTAYDGSSAAKLEVIDIGGGFPFPPFLFSTGPGQIGHPVSEKYGSLNGYYQFSPLGNDQLFVVVSMIAGDSSGVGAGASLISGATGTWTQFSVPITYLPNTPNPSFALIEFTILDTSGVILGTIGSSAIVDYLTYGAVVEVEHLAGLPQDYHISQNYPNPFNPSTNIEYSIPSESFVELNVYDILGNQVASLVNEQQQAGVYRADFTANNLPSGMYFARITANEFTQVVKMILLK